MSENTYVIKTLDDLINCPVEFMTEAMKWLAKTYKYRISNNIKTVKNAEVHIILDGKNDFEVIRKEPTT